MELEFPLAMQKIGKFEKNNFSTIVNVLFKARKVYAQFKDQSLMESVTSKLSYWW